MAKKQPGDADPKAQKKGGRKPGRRAGKKLGYQRYAALGRMERNRERRMLRTFKAQPNNRLLEARLFGRVPSTER